MKAQLLSLVLVLSGISALAEMKPAGTAVPFQCGVNEAKKSMPYVYSVCEVSIVGSQARGLTVTVVNGAQQTTYFYEAYTPAGLIIGCGFTPTGNNCLQHHKLAGIVRARGFVDRAVIGTLPTDNTIVYTVVKGAHKSLSSKFLKLDFLSSQLQPVMTTM